MRLAEKQNNILLNLHGIPNSNVHGTNMGSTWVLSAPDGPHVGPMNLAISDITKVSIDDAIMILQAFPLGLLL